MAQIDLVKAKQLCTASELRLVQASNRPQVDQLSQADLKKNIGEARRLRDKWRDQAMRQRRETQQAQGARVTEKNARSAEKAKLFADVLSRFESATPTPGKKKAAKKPTKEKRSAEHRQTRAIVRNTLAAKEDKLRVTKKKKRKAAAAAGETAPPKKKSAKKTAKKKTAKKKTAAKAAPPKAAKKKKAAPKLTPPKKKKVTRQRPPQEGGLLPASAGSFSKQIGPKTAAKKAAIKKSGLTTRTRGHVSSRVKRAQGRRDARG